MLLVFFFVDAMGQIFTSPRETNIRIATISQVRTVIVVPGKDNDEKYCIE